jgi:hypothetical protein
VKEANPFGEPFVLDGPIRGTARAPSVEPAAGDLKHVAHTVYGKGGLVLLYEREEPSGVSVVS